MAWFNETIEIVRVLINDLDETPEFSDDRLERVILVAAFQVNNTADFTQTFTVDITGGTISPDPTLSATKDESFVNLVCLKAGCIIERGAVTKAAGNAIIAREGSSSINLASVAAARQKILESGGLCSVYDEALTDYMFTSNTVAGAAIMSPFRTLAGYPYYFNINY